MYSLPFCKDILPYKTYRFNNRKVENIARILPLPDDPPHTLRSRFYHPLILRHFIPSSPVIALTTQSLRIFHSHLPLTPRTHPITLLLHHHPRHTSPKLYDQNNLGDVIEESIRFLSENLCNAIIQ